MKIRNGFVSNSSSTAFCILVPEQIHQELIKDLHMYHQAFLNAAMNKVEIAGQQFRQRMSEHSYSHSRALFKDPVLTYFEYGDELPVIRKVDGWNHTEKDENKILTDSIRHNLSMVFYEYYEKASNEYKDKGVIVFEVGNFIRDQLYGCGGYYNPELFEKYEALKDTIFDTKEPK